MTSAALFPKPEAIASGAATGNGLRRACAKRTASPRPPSGGGFAPTGAGAVRAQLFGNADSPLALPRVRANQTGGQSAGLSAFRSEPTKSVKIRLTEKLKHLINKDIHLCPNSDKSAGRRP